MVPADQHVGEGEGIQAAQILPVRHLLGQGCQGLLEFAQFPRQQVELQHQVEVQEDE